MDTNIAIDNQVLINEEEQYSLWPLSKEIPAGWKKAGFEGTKEACKAFVDAHWQNMRPKSQRAFFENTGN